MTGLTIGKPKKRKNREQYMCKVTWQEDNPERLVSMYVYADTPIECGAKVDMCLKQLKQAKS